MHRTLSEMFFVYRGVNWLGVGGRWVLEHPKVRLAIVDPGLVGWLVWYFYSCYSSFINFCLKFVISVYFTAGKNVFMENLVTCYISGNKLAILFVYWVKDKIWDFRNQEWGLLLVVLRILHQIIRLSLSCWHFGIIQHSRFFAGMGSLVYTLHGAVSWKPT